MLALYIFSLVVGGGLLTFSLVAGGKDGDADAHGDHGDHDHGDHDHGDDAGEGSASAPADAALALVGPRALVKARAQRRSSPLRSLRFWTFVTGFGGLTGTAVSLLGLAAEPVTGILAAGIGLASGAGMAAGQRLIGGNEESGVRALADYAGCEGIVLVPVAKNDPGKIRLELPSGTVDLRAVTDEKTPFSVRAPAFVVEVSADGVARVVHPPPLADKTERSA